MDPMCVAYDSGVPGYGIWVKSAVNSSAVTYNAVVVEVPNSVEVVGSLSFAVSSVTIDGVGMLCTPEA